MVTIVFIVVVVFSVVFDVDGVVSRALSQRVSYFSCDSAVFQSFHISCGL